MLVSYSCSSLVNELQLIRSVQLPAQRAQPGLPATRMEGHSRDPAAGSGAPLVRGFQITELSPVDTAASLPARRSPRSVSHRVWERQRKLLSPLPSVRPKLSKFPARSVKIWSMRCQRIRSEEGRKGEERGRSVGEPVQAMKVDTRVEEEAPGD